MDRMALDGETIIGSSTIQEEPALGKGEADLVPLKPKFKGPKTEDVACSVAGCKEVFVSEAERDNHIEFRHTVKEDISTRPQDGDASSAYHYPTYDDGETIRPNFDNDATIKPLLTEASLRKLEASIETHSANHLIESLGTMSISDHHEVDSIVSKDETTYSVLDAKEPEQLSEIAMEDTSQVIIPVRILLYLWCKLLFDYLNNGTVPLRQYAPADHGRRSSQPLSKDSASSPTVSSDVSGVSSRRRRRSPDDDDGEDERSNSGKPKRVDRKTKPSTMSPENMPLACPFCKFNGYQFGGSKNYYEGCGTWCSEKTAYFK